MAILASPLFKRPFRLSQLWRQFFTGLRSTSPLVLVCIVIAEDWRRFFSVREPWEISWVHSRFALLVRCLSRSKVVLLVLLRLLMASQLMVSIKAGGWCWAIKNGHIEYYRKDIILHGILKYSATNYDYHYWQFRMKCYKSCKKFRLHTDDFSMVMERCIKVTSFWKILLK